MKKIMLVLLTMVVLGLFGYTNSFCEDWYVIGKPWSPNYDQCVKAQDEKSPAISEMRVSSPAELIKLVGWMEHDVREKRVGGKLVEVKVVWDDTLNPVQSVTFYRYERCKEVLRFQKAEEESKKRKLKEYE